MIDPQIKSFFVDLVKYVVCFVVGVFCACLLMAVYVMPMREDETQRRVDSAYVKGAMIKISAAKTRCQQWAIRSGRAVCDD